MQNTFLNLYKTLPTISRYFFNQIKEVDKLYIKPITINIEKNNIIGITNFIYYNNVTIYKIWNQLEINLFL